MSYYCPICNKAGLPDYTTSNVVCPQCNSDLKPFLLLHSIKKVQKSKFGTFIILGISLLSMALFGLFLKSKSVEKVLITENKILNDSITKLHKVDFLAQYEKELQSSIEKKEAIIKYIVKKGDYPYKIAEFFYGDGRKYKVIEKDNNLEQPYILKVGQILTIKISQE